MITDKPKLQRNRPMEYHNQNLELTPDKMTLVDSKKLKADWPNHSQNSSDSDQLENGYEEDMENCRD